MIEYNVKNILCFALLILGILWAFTDAIRRTRKRNMKIFYAVFCCLSVAILSITMILFISFAGNEITATVEDVCCTGSLGGFMDTYTIVLQPDFGDTLHFHTSLFTPSSVNEVIASLSSGDRVRVYYGSYFDMIYDIYTLNFN